MIGPYLRDPSFIPLAKCQSSRPALHRQRRQGATQGKKKREERKQDQVPMLNVAGKRNRFWCSRMTETFPESFVVWISQTLQAHVMMKMMVLLMALLMVLPCILSHSASVSLHFLA